MQPTAFKSRSFSPTIIKTTAIPEEKKSQSVGNFSPTTIGGLSKIRFSSDNVWASKIPIDATDRQAEIERIIAKYRCLISDTTKSLLEHATSISEIQSLSGTLSNYLLSIVSELNKRKFSFTKKPIANIVSDMSSNIPYLSRNIVSSLDSLSNLKHSVTSVISNIKSEVDSLIMLDTFLSEISDSNDYGITEVMVGLGQLNLTATSHYDIIDETKIILSTWLDVKLPKIADVLSGLSLASDDIKSQILSKTLNSLL